jgi:hypothetical protein
MTGVMLGQGVVLVPLFIVHGYVRLIGGSECRGWGPCGSSSCQRVPRVPRARREYAERVGCFDGVMGARTRQKLPPEVPILPETSPQGSSEMDIGFRASSN